MYEYKYLQYDSYDGVDDALNRYAKDGWRVIHVATNISGYHLTWYILMEKREGQDGSNIKSLPSHMA